MKSIRTKRLQWKKTSIDSLHCLYKFSVQFANTIRQFWKDGSFKTLQNEKRGIDQNSSKFKYKLFLIAPPPWLSAIMHTISSSSQDLWYLVHQGEGKMKDLLTMMELLDRNLEIRTLHEFLKLIGPSCINPSKNFRTGTKMYIICCHDTWYWEESIYHGWWFKGHVQGYYFLTLFLHYFWTSQRNSWITSQTHLENPQTTWKVENCLQLIQASDDHFYCKITSDDDSASATIIVWQTGTKRADFELFCCILHLDFTKRELNSYFWTYIYIVSMDANACPHVVIECIASR